MLKGLIIVPAYNEEKCIKSVIEDAFLKTKSVQADILVVNDGSKDGTLLEAKKTGAIVIDLVNNLGIGGAVQTGYLYAYKNDYDIAIQIDGDGQHDSSYIEQMVKIIQEDKVNMVIGSRFMENKEYDQTFFRMFGINIISFIILMLTGVRIHDTTWGFRAVDKETIKRFANNYPYDYPEPDTTLQLLLLKKSIKEIPVLMKQRTTGVSSISKFKSISYMLKVIMSLLLNKIRK